MLRFYEKITCLDEAKSWAYFGQEEGMVHMGGA